jgi:isoleucyl-tRNA synthetase
MWRKLAGVFGGRAVESVHLCDYPVADPAVVDDLLVERMKLLREIASLGRKARMDAKLKVRQPLARVEVILAKDTHQAWLKAHDDLLRDELNVKQVEYAEQAADYITYEVLPNFKRLGPRLGKLLPKVKQHLSGAVGSLLLYELGATGRVSLEVDGQRVELDSEDLQVRLQAKPGWAAAHLPSCVVVLSTDLTPALVREGLARDLVRLIQERRKELDCQYTDRIQVGLVTESEELRQAIEENTEYICGETLALGLTADPLEGAVAVEHDLSGSPLQLYVLTLPAS